MLSFLADCLPSTNLSHLSSLLCRAGNFAYFELAVDSHTKISVATASVGSFKLWLSLRSNYAAVQ